MRHTSGGGATFESESHPGHYITCATEKGAKGSRACNGCLELQPSGSSGEAMASAPIRFVVGESLEEYPPLAFIATPPVPSTGSSHLLYALNEIVDERYTVYLEFAELS